MKQKEDLEDFAFAPVSPNLAGGVSIPLGTATPTDLASFSIRFDPDDAIQLVATVGWRADTNNVPANRVEVLFEMLEGMTVIYSATDSANALQDENRVTFMTHVQSNFTTTARAMYTLRATLTLAGSAGTVVGPITFYAKRIDFGK